MKIKRLFTIVLVISGILQARAQDTIVSLTLHQACQLGVDNNTNVTNAKLETQKSAYQLKEAKSKLYPQIEGYSDFNYYFAIPQMLFPGEFFGTTGEAVSYTHLTLPT